MSTGLNSMTGVIYEDMVKMYYKKEISEAEASKIMKTVVVLIGILCVFLIFVVEQMGTVIEVNYHQPSRYEVISKNLGV